MRVGCLYSAWKPPAGAPQLLSFAAVTDEPPPEVAAAGHDRMIVSLKPEDLATWLEPKAGSNGELQAGISDCETRYYEHEVLAA